MLNVAGARKWAFQTEQVSERTIERTITRGLSIVDERQLAEAQQFSVSFGQQAPAANEAPAHDAPRQHHAKGRGRGIYKRPRQQQQLQLLQPQQQLLLANAPANSDADGWYDEQLSDSDWEASDNASISSRGNGTPFPCNGLISDAGGRRRRESASLLAASEYSAPTPDGPRPTLSEIFGPASEPATPVQPGQDPFNQPSPAPSAASGGSAASLQILN